MDSYALRLLRGSVDNKKDKYSASYWALQDRNEVRARATLSNSVRWWEIYDTLLSDPVLAKLHMRAVTGVERPFDIFRATPEYDALISRLSATSKVPITKPPRPRNKAKIAAQMSLIERRLDRTDRAQIAAADKVTALGAHHHVPGCIDL